MKESYVFEYVNENEFHKLERSLKKYNMLAYKKLYFDFYPKLKDGELLGELVSTNKEKQTKNYELKLPTDVLFSKVHGDIKLHYTVYESDKIIMLNTLTPEDIFTFVRDLQKRKAQTPIFCIKEGILMDLSE